MKRGLLVVLAPYVKGFAGFIALVAIWFMMAGFDFVMWRNLMACAVALVCAVEALERESIALAAFALVIALVVLVNL